jgi:hypothetical protein
MDSGFTGIALSTQPSAFSPEIFLETACENLLTTEDAEGRRGAQRENRKLLKS